MFLIIIVTNMIIGGLVGLTGIAGFLLPMFYVSLGFYAREALALSFFAFLVSGIIGSLNYYKYNQLNLSFGIKLGFSSFIGAILGVYLNSLINESIIKIILYFVVLFSGVSILFRKDKESIKSKSPNSLIIILIGVITACICALSGAGGPILVMPLLVVVLGIKIREAIAIALFDSIFIAIPSIIGYMNNSYSTYLIFILFISSTAHGIGVFLGSKYSMKINHFFIKRSVAIISIIIALYKLFL